MPPTAVSLSVACTVTMSAPSRVSRLMSSLYSDLTKWGRLLLRDTLMVTFALALLFSGCLPRSVATTVNVCGQNGGSRLGYTGRQQAERGRVEASTGSRLGYTGRQQAERGRVEASTGSRLGYTGRQQAERGRVEASTGSRLGYTGRQQAERGRVEASTGSCLGYTGRQQASTVKHGLHGPVS